MSYANIETCGMTQWFFLRSDFILIMDFEVLTAYTPAHSYPERLAYRLNVNPAGVDPVLPTKKAKTHAQFRKEPVLWWIKRRIQYYKFHRK